MLAKQIQVAALLVLAHGSVLCRPAMAQDAVVRGASRLASRQEGEAIAQAALQHWPQIRDKPDCSHLVHDVYLEAGLNYEYATTNDIFDGMESFQRVRRPQPGDLVVWQGHVGIVIDPEDHSFYSSVISGFSVSSFSSSYWESRGPRRFYRYKINSAQSARLLSRVVYRNPRPASSVAQPVRKTSMTATADTEEDDPSDDEPVGPHETGGSSLNTNRISGATISLTREPSKEDIRSAFTKLSDVRSAELQRSSALESAIEIVDGFEIGRVETQGSFGWAELKIRKIAVLADGRMTSTNRIEKVRLPLLRESDGWTLKDPANRAFLLRPAAVRMIAARIAALSHNPGAQKDLKPLHKALGILLADGPERRDVALPRL